MLCLISTGCQHSTVAVRSTGCRPLQNQAEPAMLSAQGANSPVQPGNMCLHKPFHDTAVALSCFGSLWRMNSHLASKCRLVAKS